MKKERPTSIPIEYPLFFGSTQKGTCQKSGNNINRIL